MVNGNHSPFKLFKTNSTFSPAFQFLPLVSHIYFGGLPSYKFSVWFEFLETHDVHAMFLHNGDDFGSNSNQNLPRDFFIGTFQRGNESILCHFKMLRENTLFGHWDDGHGR